MPAFDHASRTTQGARTYQEDTAAVWPGSADPFYPRPFPGKPASEELIAVLADGMGGHAGGALASRMACEAFLETVMKPAATTPLRLVEALEAANLALARKIAADPLLSGMGSTLVGVVFGMQGVEWVSVGDSPLLLYRDGEIALLNEDHSLAPELDRLAAAGHITLAQARADPRRHMLRSAVTGEDIDMVDTSRRPLVITPGDYIILASDGVHTLDNREIARVIAAHANEGPEAVASGIIRAVEAVGDPHQDNATVVAVRAVARMVG